MNAGRFHHRGRLLAAGHLPRRLTGITQVVVPQGALISPLVREMLADAGIQLVREGTDTPQAMAGAADSSQPVAGPVVRAGTILVATEVTYEVVERAAVEAARGGKALAGPETKPWEQGAVGWGDWLAADPARRMVHFGPNPELVASIGMLRWSIPAASVHSVAQAARALSAFGPRLLAVEMPGRTLFEARHLIGLMTA